MQFEGTHQSLQSFLNTISSDPDYFFIVRATRIENGAPNGPPPNVLGVRYRGPDGKELKQEDSDAILKDLQPEVVTAKVAELNWTVVSEDAWILFGNEIIKVFAVIDVARFEKPRFRQEGREGRPLNETDFHGCSKITLGKGRFGCCGVGCPDFGRAPHP
ncbi:MAG: hypothetical protein R3F31_17270 [Verrucomicrobiales bacterium]